MSELLTKIGPIDEQSVQPPRPVKAELQGSAYVAVAEDSGDEPPVAVLFSQWSDYARRVKQQARTDVLASHVNGVAVAVDNPGVSPQSDPMSCKIKDALQSGDMSKVSILQWDNIGRILDKSGRSFGDVERLVGYSMGAHLAASAAKHAPGEVQLSQLDLFEAPALDKNAGQARRMARLVMSFLAHGGDKLSAIIASNPDWAACCRDEDPLLLPKLVLRRPAGLWRYPQAIVHPCTDIADDLSSARHHSLREAVATVSATAADKISPLEDNERLVQRLGVAGMSVMGFEIMDSVHGSQDNMAWWKGVLEEIDKRTGRQ